MRITKDADERKAEILDAAEELFKRKGYEAATISDIIEKLGVARGTVYYHFKSKEDVMDALIERTSAQLFKAAQAKADDKSIPVLDRFYQTLLALNAHTNDSAEFAQEIMHKTQNDLLHQKNHETMMKGIPPILIGIVEDGIAEGLFDTPYPHESLEMIVAHINTIFDDYADNYTEEELITRINAFIFNVERLFGAAQGSFQFMKKLFGKI
jgi:AcrR family transcriptional regulator